MKTSINLLVLLLLQSCFNNEDSRNYAYPRLRTLDINSVELSILNDKLDSTLISVSPKMISTRNYLENLVIKLDSLESALIDFTGGIIGGESYYVFYNSGDSKLTQEFFNKVDFTNSKLVVQSIRDFDSLKLSDKNLEKMVLSMMSIFDDRALYISLFDGLTLDQSVELIQIIKKRILLLENEYLVNMLINER